MYHEISLLGSKHSQNEGKKSVCSIMEKTIHQGKEQPFAILTLYLSLWLWLHLNFSYNISSAIPIVLMMVDFSFCFKFRLLLFQIILNEFFFLFFSMLFFHSPYTRWTNSTLDVSIFHCIMPCLVKFIWQLPSNIVTWVF